MKVTYPLKEITDENVHEQLGTNNQHGKYPIGESNIWHGGFHLEAKNNSTKKIQAIADGRIIAYRLTEQEKEISIDSEINKEQKINYSCSFVMMQHDYESPEGLKMSFYSVYHHLLSKTGVDDAGLKLAKFLTKTELKVTDKQEKVNGINARSAANYATIKLVIPKGAIVTFDVDDTPKTHWSNNAKRKKYNYKKVTYIDLLGTMHSDIYIATTNKRVSDTGEIQTDEDKAAPIEKGGLLKDAPKKEATIVSIVKKDTVVTKLEKKGKYTKIKYTLENGIEQEGYIYSKSLKEKETFNDEILDQIQASDIQIKAGEHIGYIGKYGVEKKPNYLASHIEIFTTDNVDDFLTNTKKDGEDKKHFAKVPKGTKLKANLVIDVDIKKDTPLKVLKFEGDYAQIKTQNIVRTVKHKYLTGWSDTTKTYKVKEAYFKTVNTIFDNKLNKSDKLHYKSQLGDNRTVFIKVDGADQKYWILKTDLAKAVINEGCDDMYTQTAEVGNVTKTNKAINKAYIEPPVENCDAESGTVIQEETVNKEHIANIGKFKKVQDDKKDTWYKAELTYTIDEKKETKKGWLKEKDVTLFSAYNWEQFGFEKLNAGSEFVYSLEDIEKQDITATVPKGEIAPFLKKVWDIVDTDKNKKLSTLEIKLAYDEPEQVDILSKLVCTHKNEWSYNIDTIKAEVQEVYDIAMGENPSKELKKQVESRILALETKMTELMFWEEAKNLAYTGDVDTKLPPRKFPSTSNVHFFHPIAWIRQMKLINGNDAPWMKFVLEEAIKYKGIKETVNPLAKAVQEKYHTYIGHPKATSATSWCASFASWSLHQAEFDNPKSWSSQKFLNHKSMKQCDIQYGAIAVFTDCYKNGKTLFDNNYNSHGHVTFVVGKLKNNEKYACLGGNQGNMLKVSDYDCSFKVFARNKKKTKFRKLSALYIPIKYNNKSNNLLEYNNIDDANKKIIKVNVKTKNNEST